MPEPTALATELANWPPAAERARRHVTGHLGDDCEQHPGEPWLDCAKCKTAEQEGRIADASKEANDRCDRKFPRRYLEARTDHPQVLAWIEHVRTAPRGDASSLLLLGPTGTGKSYQAYAALRSVVTTPYQLAGRDGQPVGMYRTTDWRALTFADLCATLRPRGRDHDPEAVLEEYRKVSMLFVDDLGAAKASEWVEEATYRLINGRYEDMRPAIFTTNLSLPELRDAIGDRIASRLAETCTRVVLDGPDRRRQK